MALEKFTIETLATMDGGRIKEAFEQALARARIDCADRPGVPSSRKVMLVATMAPVCTPAGALESCSISFEISDTLPKRVSNTYDMKAVRGGLLFNEVSRDDVNQMTIDETGPQRLAVREGNS